MKYNTYYYTRQSRYKEPKVPSIGKKLIEQFLTQVVVCAIFIILIIGSQLLGIKQVNSSMDKIRSAITYSPSLDEIAQNTKDVFSVIISRVKREDENEETVPVILIDDEVF